MAVVKEDFLPKDTVDEEETWRKCIELVQDMIKFSEIYKVILASL